MNLGFNKEHTYRYRFLFGNLRFTFNSLKSGLTKYGLFNKHLHSTNKIWM